MDNNRSISVLISPPGTPTPTPTPAPTPTPVVSSLVKNLDWYDEALTDDEHDAATALTQLVDLNQALANRVASTWLRDGVTRDEAQATVQLQGLAAIDAESATDVGFMPWLNDDIKEQEWQAIQHLQTIVRHDPQLLQTLRRMNWFIEDISVAEAERLENFSKIVDPQGNGSGIGAGVASQIAQLRWFTREIAGAYQNQLMGELAVLLARDLALGAQVVEMPLMVESIESHDVGLVRTLNELRGENLTSLTSQQWFEDGVDDDEAIVATILPSQVYRSPENFRRLLNASFVEKGSTSLPLAGEVNFAIVRVSSGGNSEIMPHLIESAHHIEGYMGFAQPIDEVILLIGAPGGERPLAGVNLGGSFIVIRPELDVCCSRPGTTFAHELIHFYPASTYSGTPPWFAEGGTRYLSYVVYVRMFGGYFTRSNTSCLADSIQQLLDHEAEVGFAQHKASAYFTCNYSLGRGLLDDLVDALGPNPFEEAWQEIQQIAREGLFVTDAEIHDIFLRHTTSDRLTLFKSAYAIWHGGDFDS
tara:strand:- start:1516 stop:3111 length:1596 start_codon:yes stop_codon:yes gene_type:complete